MNNGEGSCWIGFARAYDTRRPIEEFCLRLQVTSSNLSGLVRRNAPVRHRLAIDHELLVAVLAGGLDDPRIPVGPVVAAAGDQAHAVATALQAETIAVVLHLMKPLRAGRDAAGLGGQTELKGFKHAANITTDRASSPHPALSSAPLQ